MGVVEAGRQSRSRPSRRARAGQPPLRHAGHRRAPARRTERCCPASPSCRAPRSSANTGSSSAGGGAGDRAVARTCPPSASPANGLCCMIGSSTSFMLELEARGRSRRPIPDEAAHQHHRVQRVHADENPRDRHARRVEPPREAVDQLFERQVAQAQRRPARGTSSSPHPSRSFLRARFAGVAESVTRWPDGQIALGTPAWGCCGPVRRMSVLRHLLLRCTHRAVCPAAGADSVPYGQAVSSP